MATPTNTPMLPGLGGGVGGAQISAATPLTTPKMGSVDVSVNQIPESSSPMSSVLPQPQLGTVVNPTATPKEQAPLLSASGGAILPQGVMPTPQQVPMVGGTPLPTIPDMLNSAAPPPDLTAYGTQAPTPSKAGDLAASYSALHDTKKGTDAPQSNPMRSQATQDALAQNTPAQKEDAAKTAMDGYMAMDPVIKSIFDQMQTLVSSQATKQSFSDLYKQEIASSGLEGLNTDLMNIKNVMRGTQDDIRNEITKAGGFATESQVQALTSARNKTLLAQAQSLTDQIQAKEDYVDHIMHFTELDRNEVDKQISQQLGLDEKMMDYQVRMQDAAKDNYKTIITQGGFKSLADLTQGNPASMRMAEKTLGLPAGALQNQAFLDAMKDPNEKDVNKQFVSGTANQRSGVFDPKTGTFTPTGGGGPTSPGGGSSTGGSSQIYSDALQNIMAFGGTGPQTRAPLITQLNQKLASGDIQGAKEFIASTAIGNLPADQKNAAIGRNQALGSLTDIQGLLDAAKAKGATTNMLTGSLVDIYQKLGTTNNPDLNYISARMNTALQSYRRSMTGVAFGPQEAAEYKKIFPDLYSVDGLNAAKISALRDSFNAFNRAALSTTMGGGRVYDAIYGPPDTAVLPSDSAPTTHKPGDVVTVKGVLYQVAPDGDTINPYMPWDSLNFSKV